MMRKILFWRPTDFKRKNAGQDLLSFVRHPDILCDFLPLKPSPDYQVATGKAILLRNRKPGVTLEAIC